MRVQGQTGQQARRGAVGRGSPGDRLVLTCLTLTLGGCAACSPSPPLAESTPAAATSEAEPTAPSPEGLGPPTPILQRAAPRVEGAPVLLLTLDATRLDRLSAFGALRPTSPNLDTLASEGLRFDRCYANATWTRPSVASLMTSRFRVEHGVERGGSRLGPEQTTLAEVFAAHGYATGAFVANPTVGRAYGFDQGFGTFVDGEELGPDPAGGAVVDRALAWVGAQRRPWFLWLFLVDPHTPYDPAPAFDRWSTRRDVEPLRNPLKEVAEPPAEAVVARTRDVYDAELAETDAALGELFRSLKARGLWDGLTVVVVADHGELLGEHGAFLHSYHMWEPNVHVPLLVKTPALTGGAGTVDSRPWQSVDVMPTLLDLAGLRPPPGWRASGQNMVPVLTGHVPADARRPLFAEFRSSGVSRWMVRQGRYKLVRFDPTDQAAMRRSWPDHWAQYRSALNTDRRDFLYDLEADPEERRNLRVRAPEAYRALLDTLEAFQRAHLAPEPDGAGPDEEERKMLRAMGYVE